MQSNQWCNEVIKSKTFVFNTTSVVIEENTIQTKISRTIKHYLIWNKKKSFTFIVKLQYNYQTFLANSQFYILLYGYTLTLFEHIIT